MKTAESYYHSYVQYERADVSEGLKQSILAAIMAAKIEAIKASSQILDSYNIFIGGGSSATPDLQAEILKLINEVK